MPSAAFRATDFKIFDIKGFQPRMAQARIGCAGNVRLKQPSAGGAGNNESAAGAEALAALDLRGRAPGSNR